MINKTKWIKIGVLFFAGFTIGNALLTLLINVVFLVASMFFSTGNSWI
jgi:hypothetical protein